ncbi:DNA repair protein XRCC4 [Iris pallida]|uniref:DNA repair protein XRCC4 n=1 Tax=Iris pallida TaxID=29817 RepID=A0AAX6GBP4_IRIPA|nr:DNA repair protein XRCC4 [Iris pallida]KAJ6852418.1 DNA repair protein XRCC4 [Iris pallida]
MGEGESSSSTSATRHSCLKLQTDPSTRESIFIKGTWFPSHFRLLITDGLHAWTCDASEPEVRQRAEQWDQPPSEYVALAETYLGFQQPGSTYGFQDAGNGQKRLSWTFEKQGTKLEWRWKCQPSSDSKQTTAGILDFLMDANIRLSDEVVRKTQSFERLKGEAERCLSQSERFNKEKTEFESAVYAKFVAVLNSKKAKLRELRDRISKLEAAGKAPVEEGDSTDKTESFDEKSDDELVDPPPSTSKNVAASTPKGRKRRT